MTFIVTIETDPGNRDEWMTETIGPFESRDAAEQFAARHIDAEPIDGGYKEVVFVDAESATTPEAALVEVADVDVAAL